MKSLLKITLAGMLMASPAFSGGWEASRLDSSMMYQDGSYAEVGTSSISYDIIGKTQATAGTSHKMAKDQTRTSLGFKMQYGDFDIGLTNYLSGAIQLDGQATAAHKAGATCPTNGAGIALCSTVPSGDVDMKSLALLGRYRLNDNISFLGGINRYSVSNGMVQTLSGYYEKVTGDEMVPLAGAAYENKEIALRVELLVQLETDMSLTANTSAAKVAPTTAASNSKLTVPQTITLNFQSGIAEDTLLFGSIHQADWDNAQISIPANNSAAAILTEFASRTAYSVGIGRKLTDAFSVLGSYSTEDGGGATSTDPFTLTDGSQSLGLGVRYTRDNMTVTGGYSYSKVGDVKVTKAVGGGLNLTADYKDNTVTGLGVKIGFSF